MRRRRLPPRRSAPASATTYTDGSGIERTATSNSVYTVVQQVASLTLTADNSKPGTAGSPVVFPHTLTNTGNGPDTYTLTAANIGGDANDYSSIVIYADANGDGVADNTTPITQSPTLAAGESFKFVVVAVVPSSASNDQTLKLTITATSQFDGTKAALNTDTTTVTSNAVVNVTKAIDVNSGFSPSGPYTYTFTYKNSGNTVAKTLAISDTIPTGMTYVASSGEWNGVALSDGATPADPTGITYAVSGQVVTATVDNVPAGATGKITFRVTVNSGLAVSVLNNTATFSYDDDNNGTTPAVSGSSNTVPFTVKQTAGVTFDDWTITDPADLGQTVIFKNTLTNTGNGTDTFDITVPAGTISFPAGTTYVLLKNDGQTPLMDSNNNGIPDTGPLATGATYDVYIQVTLPTGAAAVGGPYTLKKVATSVFDSTKTDDSTDTLNSIRPTTVDLTNDAAVGSAGAKGVGPGPGAAPVTNIDTIPGKTVRFTLFVNNTSSIGDTYNLQASATSTFAPPAALPANWTVTFRNTNGEIITNTGIVAAAGNKEIYADVFVPNNYQPGAVAVYFRAYSPTTGASDSKYDQVTVLTYRSVKLTPNNTGQLYAGNTIVYSHTIANLGNVTEGNNGTFTVALASVDDLVAAGWTSVIYFDVNNDGKLDPNDPVIADLHDTADFTGAAGTYTGPGLAPGASKTILVKVYAPAGAAAGDTNVTTITATIAGTTADGTVAPAATTAKDTSVVIAGDLKLEKWQKGPNDADYKQVNTTAKPGEIIRYKIVITNYGTAPATGVTITDFTPTFTVYDDGDGTNNANTGAACYQINTGALVLLTTPNVPADGTIGQLKVSLGATPLKPTESVTLYFGVKINPVPAPAP